MPRQLCLLLAFSSSIRISGNTLRGHHAAEPDKLGIEASQNIRHSSKRRLSTSLIATEDATIRSSTPYTNYGTDDTLSFISPPTTATSDNKVETLLKFDLQSLTPPTSTYLHLFATAECNFSTLPIAPNLGLIAVAMAENMVEDNAVGSTEKWEWNEESVNWYNSPMVTGGEIVKSLGDLEGGAWVEIGACACL
jgi:hypothetical protein